MMTVFSELFRTVLIMSISGGVVALLLFAIKPLAKHRLPKATQYYFWLVPLFLLIFPASQVITLPARAENFAPPSISAVVERNVITFAEEVERLQTASFIPAPPAEWYVPTIEIMPEETIASPTITVIATTLLIAVYPVMIVLLLGFNLVCYIYFVAKLRKSLLPAQEEACELLKSLSKDKRLPKIYRNRFAVTPMLIGLFHPSIVLPYREFSASQLNSILLHELTHMHRKDVAIKWLTLVVCALHWFNPVVWLMRREIDRACELSCDEAVTRRMTVTEKGDYGNTLISVAAESKLPIAIVSTTMCEEKKTLQERLVSIMKNKKHTKILIIFCSILVLAAAIAACSFGLSRDATESPMETEYTNYEPPLQLGYMALAEQHIANIAENLHTGPYVRWVDTRINEFYKIAEFDHLGQLPVEVWRLDFAVQMEALNDEVRWGSFFPDEDGWISHATALNEARTLLVITRNAPGGSRIQLRGAVPWFMEILDTSTVWQAEIAARAFLESIDYLTPMLYVGETYLAYFDFGGFEYGRLLLTQPATRGEGGIWAVERWQQVEHLHIHFAPPESDTLNSVEFYAEQQRLFDAGEAPWRGVPYYVARQFLNNQGWDESYAPILDIVRISHFSDPLSIQPHVGLGAAPIMRFAEDFSDAAHMRLRQQVLEDMDLAFNEAYQFQMENGDYALITGWRPLSGAEFVRYFPHLGVPEQFGVYQLQYVVVNDGLFNRVRVSSAPNSSNSHNAGNHFYEGEIVPVGKVVERNRLVPFAFYAVYRHMEDPDGKFVGLGVFPPFMSPPSHHLESNMLTTHAMGHYGDIHFVGEHAKFVALFEDTGEGVPFVIELAFIDPLNFPVAYFGWTSLMGDFNAMGMIPVQQALLEELVYVFNPVALAEAFNWQLTSWQ